MAKREIESLVCLKLPSRNSIEVSGLYASDWREDSTNKWKTERPESSRKEFTCSGRTDASEPNIDAGLVATNSADGLTINCECANFSRA